jgi:hypothetical protein
MAAKIGEGIKIENLDDGIKPMSYDPETHTIAYDPRMIDSLRDEMTERERFGITMREAMLVINDRKVGEYKIPQTQVDEPIEDDLPSNTTKPKFLMQRDHHIRRTRKGK